LEVAHSYLLGSRLWMLIAFDVLEYRDRHATEHLPRVLSDGVEIARKSTDGQFRRGNLETSINTVVNTSEAQWE
jgi:hypothetical protein